MMQMIALGDLQDLSEGRDLIRHSFQDEMNIYIPSDISIWENAKKMWVELVSQKKIKPRDKITVLWLHIKI